MTPNLSACGRISALASLGCLLSLALSNRATAATFEPIAGSIAVRAGGNSQQITPAVLGPASLSDNSLPSGFDFATASLQTSLVGGRLFNFSGSASSLTNVAAPAGQSNAIASISFEQTFATTGPQWIEISATVLSPPTDADVTAEASFGRTGQPALVSIGHTEGAASHHGGAYAAGSFVLSGQVSTAAKTAGSHAGAVSGSVRIAAIADFDGNNVVNAADLNVLKVNFGSGVGVFIAGDLDGDGRTDGADILLWQRQFGVTLPPVAVHVIPEPSSAALLPLAIGIFISLRRMKTK